MFSILYKPQLIQETNLSKKATFVFIGTYTEHEGSQSKGIYVYRMDPSTGDLNFEWEAKGILNPAGRFRRRKSAADLHISGRHLYASNRRQDSIAWYLIDENTGRLSYEGERPSEGKEPRGFAIDPRGNFLLAAHERSDNVVLFKIDASTGKLLSTGYEVKVSQPVCVKFTYLEQ
jgi:6-phosphogluconolactonase (cycloisomerase 2 family)